MWYMTPQQQEMARQMFAGATLSSVGNSTQRTAVVHEMLAGRLGGIFNDPERRSSIRYELSIIDNRMRNNINNGVARTEKRHKLTMSDKTVVVCLVVIVGLMVFSKIKSS